jgi:hypothetical protein
VSGLAGAGLALELLREHDYALYPQWPFLEEHDKVWRMPAGGPRLPLMYSLRARAPYPR